MKFTSKFKRNVLVLGASIAAIGYMFSIATTSIGVILFLITWQLNFTELNFRGLYKINKLHLLAVLFLILLIGVSYSTDLEQAQNDIVRHLSYILLPLIFLTSKPFTRKESDTVIKTYVYALTVFFIICLFNAIYRQVNFSNQGGPFNWYFFYRYDFLEIFKQHPTYVSMYVLLSISYILNNGKKLFKKKWTAISLLIIQVLSIVFFGSRIGYIILLLILLIHTYKNLKLTPKKVKIKQGLIYFTSIISLLIISWNIPIVKERIQFTFGYQQDYKFNNKELIQNKTPEEQGRLLLWEDAFELIKERPVLGYGTGSPDKILYQKYKEKGHLLFLEKKYNTHNTYLELLLIGGATLLFVYLLALGALLYRGIKRKDTVLLSFFLIISITGLTETLFIAQGIVFFSFFFCFLLSTKKYNE